MLIREHLHMASREYRCAGEAGLLAAVTAPLCGVTVIYRSACMLILAALLLQTT